MLFDVIAYGQGQRFLASQRFFMIDPYFWKIYKKSLSVHKTCLTVGQWFLTTDQ